MLASRSIDKAEIVEAAKAILNVERHLPGQSKQIEALMR
jgi:hypothetical protein